MAEQRRDVPLCYGRCRDVRLSTRFPVTREAARLYSTFFLSPLFAMGRLELPSPTQMSPVSPGYRWSLIAVRRWRSSCPGQYLSLSLGSSIDGFKYADSYPHPPHSPYLRSTWGRMEGIFDLVLKHDNITALNATVGGFLLVFNSNFVSLRLDIKGEILLLSSLAKGFAVLRRRVN